MQSARFGVAIQLAVALAFTCDGGCERSSRSDGGFERHELPGFSLELPAGKTYGTPSLEYPLGSLAITNDHDVAIVEWSATGKLEGDELQMALQAIGALTHAKPGAKAMTRSIGGAHVDTMHVDTDRGVMSVSQVPCGRRNILLATTNISGSDDDARHLRMLESVICKPDATREAALATTRVDVHVDLPSFGAVSRDDNQLTLSDGRSMLLLQPMVAMTDDKLLDAVQSMLTAAFKGAITAGERRGDFVPLLGALDGQAVVGWAKLIPCARSKTLALELSPTEAEANKVATAVSAATCLAPDAPTQVWPDAPKSGAAQP